MGGHESHEGGNVISKGRDLLIRSAKMTAIIGGISFVVDSIHSVGMEDGRREGKGISQIDMLSVKGLQDTAVVTGKNLVFRIQQGISGISGGKIKAPKR